MVNRNGHLPPSDGRSAQIATSKRALTTAEEGLRLAEQRQEFAVGSVPENVQAEQDLPRAGTD